METPSLRTRILVAGLVATFLVTIGVIDKTNLFRPGVQVSENTRLMSRLELEDSISTVLSGKVIALLTSPEVAQSNPNGPGFVTKHLSIDSAESGFLVSQTDIRFEGCVLVKTIENYASNIVVQTRIDLSFLETNYPVEYDSSNAYVGSLGTRVSWRLRPDIAKRLAAVHRESRVIFDQGYARYPRDIQSRLIWFAKSYEQRIDDKIYLDAGEITSHSQGVVVVSPSIHIRGEYTVYFDNAEHERDILEFIHQYRVAYCTQ